MFAIDAPAWIKACADKFSLSYNQKRLFARYVTGLIASNNKTVSGISSIFINQNRVL